MYMSGTLQKKMGNGRRRELIILIIAVSQKVNFCIVKVSLGNPLSIHALQQQSFLVTPPGRQQLVTSSNHYYCFFLFSLHFP